ncbi:WD40 repeat-like protein [Dacryopinax primogenitus]|uniref:WD40 repeat-like protein n=1 Tax=Dacryopinax primogenitus (strain DJM 731) TaxID=1858805 RepID=M5G8R1_DACPD|nr:WD40 repeat-like protein [Dacryopinax primogenitus]EJU02232.1 WD40 repeat-like protein [Dacryopinax primogenitus]
MDVDVKPFYGPAPPPPLGLALTNGGPPPPSQSQVQPQGPQGAQVQGNPMNDRERVEDERATIQRDRERELMDRSRPGAGHPAGLPEVHREPVTPPSARPGPPVGLGPGLPNGGLGSGPVPPAMPLSREVEPYAAPLPLPALPALPPNRPNPLNPSRSDRPSQTGTLIIQQNLVHPGEEPRPAEMVDMDRVPPEYRTEGGDWFAIYNPHVPRVLDVKLVHTLLHESVVCCVRFSSDGTRLATGCNRSAQIYDTKTGVKIMQLVDESNKSGGDLYIRSVCFSPDGKLLATGAEDRQVRIWDLVRKNVQYIFEGHQQEIYSLCFSPDGRYIVSGSGDKTACVWELGESRLPPLPEGHESAPKPGMCAARMFSITDQAQPPSPDPDGRTPATQQDAGVTSVAVSADGRFVACGSLDCVVRIWDVQSGQLIERLRGHRDSVYSVAFSPDGKALVSGSLDKTLKWWSLSDLKSLDSEAQRARRGRIVERRESMTLGGHRDYVLSVAMSPDGKWIVSGSKDRGVQFWNPHTATTQFVLQGHKNSVISIDMSGGQGPPGSGLLATGSGDYQARIWSYGPYYGPGSEGRI